MTRYNPPLTVRVYLYLRRFAGILSRLRNSWPTPLLQANCVEVTLTWWKIDTHAESPVITQPAS